MTKSLLYSIIFHAMMIVLTALSLPFMTREPISLPPIVSVELIQITDKTNIPFAPKARKIIDKVKKEEKELSQNKHPLRQKPKKNLIEFLYQMIKKKKRDYKKETKSRGD